MPFLSPSKIVAGYETLFWGSPIGSAGCGIWLFLGVIFEIWAENRGGKSLPIPVFSPNLKSQWEALLRAGAGFRVLWGSYVMLSYFLSYYTLLARAQASFSFMRRACRRILEWNASAKHCSVACSKRKMYKALQRYLKLASNNHGQKCLHIWAKQTLSASFRNWKKKFFVDSQTPLYPFSMLKNATVDTVKWLQH